MAPAPFLEAPKTPESVLELPDEIFDTIWKRLETWEMACFSLSSFKNLDFCISWPMWTVDSSHLRDRTKRQCFIKFFNWYLARREHKKMESFELNWEVTKIKKGRIRKQHEILCNWITEALRCNLEKLKVYIRGGSLCRLPIFVFQSKLTHLSLQNVNIELPVAGFDFLKVVELSWVSTRESHDLGDWLSSCKVLENVSLSQTQGQRSLRIHSPSIKRLEIFGSLDGIYDFDIWAEELVFFSFWWKVRPVYPRSSLILKAPFNPSSSLTLKAPNVQYLEMGGDLVRECKICAFNSLKKASLFMHCLVDTWTENVASAEEICGRVKGVRSLHALAFFVKVSQRLL